MLTARLIYPVMDVAAVFPCGSTTLYARSQRVSKNVQFIKKNPLPIWKRVRCQSDQSYATERV